MREHIVNVQVSFGEGIVGRPFNLSLPNPRLWSPVIFGGEPFLYDIEVSLYPAAANSTAAKSTAVANYQTQARTDHHLYLPIHGCMVFTPVYWLSNAGMSPFTR